MVRDLKQKFFNYILGLSHSFHTSNKTGSLISRLTRGGRAIERMSDILLFNFTPLIFQLILVGVSLVFFSWIPAVVAFLTVFLFIGYSFLMQHIQQF